MDERTDIRRPEGSYATLLNDMSLTVGTIKAVNSLLCNRSASQIAKIMDVCQYITN